MAYSTTDDLLIGDLTLSAVINTQKVVDDAALEMDARLGLVYQLPIPAQPAGSPAHTLLRLVNNRLASGRLIIEAAFAAEDKALHRYGESLLEEACKDLERLASGAVPFVDVTLVSGSADDGPKLIQADAESAVDVFEQFAYRGECVYWAPGSVP